MSMTPSERRDISLLIFRELRTMVRASCEMVTADDDPSGYCTRYLIDQSEFLRQLQSKIVELGGSEDE